MVGADSRNVSRVLRYSGTPQGLLGFRLRVCHPLWSNFPNASPTVEGPIKGPTTPGPKAPVWAVPLSLATTHGITSFSFPPVTEMFHFTGYRVSIPILFRMERLHITGVRLPHSEISGSQPVCGYPKLIAAYHVLHRLLAPRHSLYALNSLIPVLEIS